MRKYVESKDKKSYIKTIQNVYDNRIVKYAQQGLKDLTLLAEALPERQLENIFNKENMKPLFEALFKLKPDNRKRILSLWRAILMDVANTTYVLNVVGRERWQMITRPKSTELQALFSTVLFEA